VPEPHENSGPNGPTAKTVKRLFGESGNICAFANCSQPIIAGTSVVGKVCHIKAKSPGGQRYDPAQSDEERHGYDNLILLCGIHHDIVDDDEALYTVERLQQMKAAHRARTTHLSDEDADSGARFLISNPVISFQQSGGITASNVIINNYGPINLGMHVEDIALLQHASGAS